MNQNHSSTSSERMLHHTSLWSDAESLSGISVDVLTDEELVKAVNDLRKQIQVLKLENEVLEKSIIRLDPALMTGVHEAYKYYTKHGSSSQHGSFVRNQISKFKVPENKLSAASRIIGTTSKMFHKESGPRLVGRSQLKINIQEKNELLTLTIEHQEKELNYCKRNEKKQHELLKAKMKACELWIIDIKNSTQDFREQVLVKGYDHLTQRIPAEIWIKFMMEWSKMADKKIGKLRLRTSTLNTHHRKLKDSIGVKQELSKNLTAVDFDKLIIENKEAEKLLEKKKEQLEELKEMAGDANLQMTIHKKSLMLLNTYLTKLTNMKAHRKIQTAALDKEHTVMKLHVEHLEQRLNEIKRLRKQYETLDINDYVAVKDNKHDLLYHIKRLETKLRIMQIAVHSSQKQLLYVMSTSLTETSGNKIKA